MLTVGKAYQKWKPLQPSTSHMLQVGGGEAAGDKKESLKPDQLDISTSDAHIPSILFSPQTASKHTARIHCA